MLTSDQMRDLARAGARQRIHDLQEEIAELESAFPETPRPASKAADSASDALPRRRRTMTAAQRKAASARMKAMWRGKKAAQAG